VSSLASVQGWKQTVRMRSPSYVDLMRCSRFPNDLRTAAFTGAIAKALATQRRPLIRGMPEDSFQRLLRSCFIDVALCNGEAADCEAPDVDEFDDLLSLLLDNRTQASEINGWLACCVASAAMHDGHLWQDMGLPDRAQLSRLLYEYFPALATKNVGDMKWKKFFYRQLCQRAGLTICKSPNCADCSDYQACFGPEANRSPVASLAYAHG